MGDAAEKRDRITYPESTIRRWLSGWVPPRFLDQALAELREAAGVDVEKPPRRKPSEAALRRADAMLRRAGVARR